MCHIVTKSQQPTQSGSLNILEFFLFEVVQAIEDRCFICCHHNASTRLLPDDKCCTNEMFFAVLSLTDCSLLDMVCFVNSLNPDCHPQAVNVSLLKLT